MTKSEKPELLHLELDAVEEPLHLLRQPDEDTQGFQDLVNSMRDGGWWPSEPGEVDKDPTGAFVLVDGLNRKTAALRAGLKKGYFVLSPERLTEVGRLERAIAHNATVIETRPVEYAKAVTKWLELNPGATIVDAAKKFRKSTAWVGQRMKVAKLEGEAAKLVDAGKIPLETAGALARLQAVGGELGKELLAKCARLSASEVVNEIDGIAKALKEKRAEEPRDLNPPKLRVLGDVRAEWERAKQQETPCYAKALEWALKQDPASLQACMAEKCPLFAEGASALVATPGDMSLTAVDGEAIRRLIHVALGAGAEAAAVCDALGETRLLEAADAELTAALAAEEPAALAKRLGVDAKTVRRWVSGERNPDYGVRKALLGL